MWIILHVPIFSSASTVGQAIITKSRIKQYDSWLFRLLKKHLQKSTSMMNSFWKIKCYAYLQVSFRKQGLFASVFVSKDTLDGFLCNSNRSFCQLMSHTDIHVYSGHVSDMFVNFSLSLEHTYNCASKWSSFFYKKQHFFNLTIFYLFISR